MFMNSQPDEKSSRLSRPHPLRIHALGRAMGGKQRTEAAVGGGAGGGQAARLGLRVALARARPEWLERRRAAAARLAAARAQRLARAGRQVEQDVERACAREHLRRAGRDQPRCRETG